MKNFLLEKKWTGVLCTLIVAFAVSYLSSSYAAKFVKAMAPTVVAEASDFLPITLEQGAITEPKETVISKNYGTNTAPILVVLDTRVDELNSTDLQAQGLYISRKFIYGVSSKKTEIRSFADLPDMTINHQMLENGAEWLEKYAGIYAFGILFVTILIYIAIAVLLYSAIIHLIIGKAMKSDFTRTLRVTTLSYLLLFVLGAITVSFGIIITFVLLLFANYAVAKYIK